MLRAGLDTGLNELPYQLSGSHLPYGFEPPRSSASLNRCALSIGFWLCVSFHAAAVMVTNHLSFLPTTR